MSKQLCMAGLGYSGLLPFLIAVYMLLSGTLLPAADVVAVFISYSTVILAFLGGSLWSRSLVLQESNLASLLLVVSNLIALSGWFYLLLGGVNAQHAVAGLAVGYMFTLLLELRFAPLLLSDSSGDFNSEYGNSYRNLRIILTAVVVIAHVSVFFSIA